MFLTDKQLYDLIHKRRPSAQAKWLRAKGWRFELRDDGSVILHEDEARARLCSDSKPAHRRTRPDLGALNG